jgi:HMG (high mobility group) box
MEISTIRTLLETSLTLLNEYSKRPRSEEPKKQKLKRNKAPFEIYREAKKRELLETGVLVQDVTKKAAEEWRKMNDEEKEVWHKKAGRPVRKSGGIEKGRKGRAKAKAEEEAETSGKVVENLESRMEE